MFFKMFCKRNCRYVGCNGKVLLGGNVDILVGQHVSLPLFWFCWKYFSEIQCFFNPFPFCPRDCIVPNTHDLPQSLVPLATNYVQNPHLFSLSTASYIVAFPFVLFLTESLFFLWFFLKSFVSLDSQNIHNFHSKAMCRHPNCSPYYNLIRQSPPENLLSDMRSGNHASTLFYSILICHNLEPIP